MLDQDLKTQLAGYLQRVAQPFEMVASLDDSDNAREKLDLLQTIQSLRADKITLRTDGTDARKPSFTLQRTGTATSLRFAGLPLGHEFTSLVLALLQAGGYPPKVEAISGRLPVSRSPPQPKTVMRRRGSSSLSVRQAFSSASGVWA